MDRVIRKITSGKQVTLPPDFCEKNDLQVGELVAMHLDDGKLIIEPYRNRSKALEKLEELFKTLPGAFGEESEESLLETIDEEISATRKKHSSPQKKYEKSK
ncbi:hypothetical protein NF27_DC00030 [Candidatus Jidaibacter acanthamoeba]|uniref:SpoVT-AbrB domain-containing protein n=1 Tax=Candidatus Jidaibacter acanthamoebae TaxID=86105 RepID=A0A0C1QJN5_9RICK|nr:AbrB/MazE/SpoVT family DNA-binding domain-containing protein [Candidatus Jidaibacter acanthamoeba]KIE05724.1 hypothetical protein NF27_DC00030 [Candidatus Jidaibacter acanthamoeba]